MSLALDPSLAVLVCWAAGLLSLLAMSHQEHRAAAAPALGPSESQEWALALLCKPLCSPAGPLAAAQLLQPLVEVVLQRFVLEARAAGLVASPASSRGVSQARGQGASPGEITELC